MATLYVYALGRLCALYDQTPLTFPTKKTQYLLCLLLLHAGETLNRELIAERLWPMCRPGKARRCLSTTLWRLRKTLERHCSSAQPRVLAEDSTLAFNTGAPYWFDVEAFEQQAAVGLTDSSPRGETQRQALEKSLELYRGDLLENCYEDWCLAERERLQLLLLQVLRRLQYDYRLCQAFDVAVSCGRRLLALDPLQEDVHRELMHCYVDAGQHHLALKQFHHCREILNRELQIEPMPETQELYRQIRAAHERSLALRRTMDRRDSLETVLPQIRRALDDLESVREMLQRVAVELAKESEFV